MQIRRFPLDHELEILEYQLDIEEGSLVSKGKPKANRKKELERYAKLYHGETLIDVDGTQYPLVLVADFDLDDITIDPLSEKYTVPSKFSRFAQGALQDRLNPKTYNGPCIGIVDLKTDNELGRRRVKLVGRRTSYFDFLATNRSMDVPLSVYDPSFDFGQTLRDYEIDEQGRARLRDSNMANTLATGFIVLVYEDEKPHIILGKRKGSLGVESSTISIPGGTPEWTDDFHDECDFSSFLRNHVEKELREELCLQPNEYKVHKAHLLNDFTRAPEIFFHIQVNPKDKGGKSLRIKDIAQRCYDQRTVEEHSAIYSIPLKQRSLKALVNGDLEHDINLPSIVAMHLAINEVKQ